MEKRRIIGIDLGTTNSVVAVNDNGQPRIIPSPEGGNKIPSVVAFLKEKEVTVGEIAKRQAATNPTRTITSVKRLMGKYYSSLSETDMQMGYQIINDGDLILINIDNSGFSPEQISGFILKKLKETAERYLNEEVTEAIITVPAHFDDMQRQATKEAARLAGLEVNRLINEPTAAAMAYGLGKEDRELVAVYDFGGGTFDISILEVDNNTFEVAASNGDSYLGGDDLDSVLVNNIVQEFNEKYTINLTANPVALRRLKEAAEKAKCEISLTDKSIINLPFIAQRQTTPLHLTCTIRREDFENLIMDYIYRTLKVCENTLKDARVSKSDLSKVILVGGSTRIPLVQEMVEEFFEMEPFKGVNPDEVVALGAAAQAGVLEGKLEEVVLLDVVPHSLGVEVKDDGFSKIIEKNSTVPIKAQKIFTTTTDKQAAVNIHILQGEEDKASENKSLGQFTLSGIEPMKAGVPRISVIFYINAEGILEINATDLQSKAEKKLTIVHSFLADKERREGTHPAETDRRRRSRRRKRSLLDAVRLKRGSDKEKAATSSQSPQRTAATISFIEVTEGETPETAVPLTSETEKSVEQKVIDSVSDATSEMDSLLPLSSEQTQMDTSPKILSTIDIETLSPVMTKAQEIVTTFENIDPSQPEKIEELRADEEVLHTLKGAIAEFEKVLEVNPDDPAVFFWLIRVHLALDEPMNALRTIDHYLSSTSSKKPVALDMYTLLIKRVPDGTDALSRRSLLYEELGQSRKAINDLEKLIVRREAPELLERLERLYMSAREDEESPSLNFKLVKIFLKKKKIDEAISLLKKLAGCDDYKERAFKIMGLCYWQKNMHYLAWHHLKDLTLTDELKNILYRLAADMEATDQLVNAKSVYQKVSNEDSAYRDVEIKLRKLDYRLKLQKEDLEKTQSSEVFRDSRFIILEEINRGSMGVVYKVKDKVLDEIVALKVLNDFLCSDADAVERFKREAKAARRLSSPYIVRIHDLYERGTKRFISMEYIEGSDLKQLINSNVDISAMSLIEYCKQICMALEYAHEMNIIHRDIKPANLMITTDNTIKITDFGIAKMLKGEDATVSGTAIIGTPLYMAPEQIIGKGVDARSDIYSLGIVIYEVLAGRPPFIVGNIEYHHVHTAPPEIEVEANEDLKMLVMKCIEKEPDKRFQAAAELLDALNNIEL